MGNESAGLRLGAEAPGADLDACAQLHAGAALGGARIVAQPHLNRRTQAPVFTDVEPSASAHGEPEARTSASAPARFGTALDVIRIDSALNLSARSSPALSRLRSTSSPTPNRAHGHRDVHSDERASLLGEGHLSGPPARRRPRNRRAHSS